MLSSTELDQWCCSLNLSSEARALIDRIRNSEPVRSVHGYKSVIGRFPSRKMGMTIQFESHKNELAFIYTYEHGDDDDMDEAVLEYYDQPSTIKLLYESVKGRHLGVLHVPDFFVIRSRSAGWEECKPEEQLVKLSAKYPNRYVKDSEGKWRCPPGEIYSAGFGLYYRIRSSKEINWNFQRSIEFLDDFFRNDSPSIDPNALPSLLQLVTEGPGITLKELFTLTDGIVTRDDVFMLIASGELYVNLREAPLIEMDRVRVYPDRDTALAYKNLIHNSNQSIDDTAHFVSVVVGNSIRWGNNYWTIATVDEGKIGLIASDGKFLEVQTTTFTKLVQERRILGVNLNLTTTHPEVKERLQQADRIAFAEANRRSILVRAYISGDLLIIGTKIPERTLRYWVSQYLKAKEIFGNGYIGLIPKRRSGNTQNKLSTATQVLINEFIEKDYETHKQKRKFEVYAFFLHACHRRGILPVSYKTFIKAIKMRSRYLQTLNRKGSKAAYEYKEFVWELTFTTPRHGEFPLHVAHIDHTELDAELVYSLTGVNLGRAWATILTDAYTRRFVVYVTYDPPSYRSCMMILRECVRRFGRLPQIVVVDRGLEFSSTYFETLLAFYECTKKTRPSAEGRFGSVCERLFGTTNTRFIHNLQGNTQIMRNVRQVSKSVNPRAHAIWTLELLYLYLREWAYEVYDTIEHPALGQSPRDAFAQGLSIAGERAHRLITYDENFRMLTLPTTPKSTAKVCPGRGVKINYRYFWSDAFRHPEVEGKRVNVRFDPFNAGLSYAYVRGQWIECESELHRIFHNKSERELIIATAELRKQQKHHSGRLNITAATLGRFLESVEAQEILLRQQMADREGSSILTMIEGGLTSTSGESANSITKSIKPSGVQDLNSSSDKSSKNMNLEVYGEF